jgi:hypothetical protein
MIKAITLTIALAISGCIPCTTANYGVCVFSGKVNAPAIDDVDNTTRAVIGFWSEILPAQAVTQAVNETWVYFRDERHLKWKDGKKAWGLTSSRYIQVAYDENELFVQAIYAHELAHVIINYAWPGGMWMGNDAHHELMRSVGFL